MAAARKTLGATLHGLVDAGRRLAQRFEVLVEAAQQNVRILAGVVDLRVPDGSESVVRLDHGKVVQSGGAGPADCLRFADLGARPIETLHVNVFAALAAFAAPDCDEATVRLRKGPHLPVQDLPLLGVELDLAPDFSLSVENLDIGTERFGDPVVRHP